MEFFTSFQKLFYKNTHLSKMFEEISFFYFSTFFCVVCNEKKRSFRAFIGNEYDLSKKKTVGFRESHLWKTIVSLGDKNLKKLNIDDYEKNRFVNSFQNNFEKILFFFVSNSKFVFFFSVWIKKMFHVQEKINYNFKVLSRR